MASAPALPHGAVPPRSSASCPLIEAPVSTLPTGVDASAKELAQTHAIVKLSPSVRGSSSTWPALLALLLAAQTAGEEPRPQPPPPPQRTRVDVHSFRVVESYSGPVSYYKIVED